MYDSESKPYESALPIRKKDTYEQIAFYMSVILDAIRVIIFSIPSYVKLFINIFVNRPKKSIARQVVLITGGGNGIGRQLALTLAEEKCNIAIADIDLQAAQKTAAELAVLNIKAKAYCVDVSDLEAIKKLHLNIEADLGSVDILINNAGIIPVLSILDGTGTEIDQIFKINALSMYYTTRVFLPGMLKKKRGHIVAMSSLSAFYAIPVYSIYSASKFAVEGIMEALSEQLLYEGHNDYIHTTTVYPYFVSTRKDVMDSINLRFPAITSREVAKTTVDAILKNERIVTVPKYHKLLQFLSGFMTYEMQRYIKYYIMNQQTTYVTNK